MILIYREGKSDIIQKGGCTMVHKFSFHCFIPSDTLVQSLVWHLEHQ